LVVTWHGAGSVGQENSHAISIQCIFMIVTGPATVWTWLALR